MNLFPKAQTPYYIFCPSYDYRSSGVRALHILCHALNEAGQRAYLYPDNPIWGSNPSLNTPAINMLPEHMNYYNQNGVDPIIIYPDKIACNPLNAEKIVRYLLAPAGLYGGPTDFPGEEVWSYLPGIAESQGNDRVLRVPVTDRNIFHTPKISLQGDHRREGLCFYSRKYDLIHGNRLLSLTADMRRIEGRPENVAELLRNSRACYTYENSQIIQEAQLCGCPVVLIRTEYFNKFETKDGHIPYGVRWHDEDEFLAESSSPAWHLDVIREYRKIESEFETQLDRFIKVTQNYG